MAGDVGLVAITGGEGLSDKIITIGKLNKKDYMLKFDKPLVFSIQQFNVCLSVLTSNLELGYLPEGLI